MSRLFTAAVVAADRARPEDAATVIRRGAAIVFVVADGAGGVGGGARAAELVVARVVALAHVALQDDRQWTTLLQDLDAELVADDEAGESTAVIGAVVGDRIVGASVGDSEAWLISASGYIVLTSRQHRARLGSGQASPTNLEARLGDALLLVATDGLFGPASPDAICTAARAAAPADTFVELARSRSGRLYDDVGLVVIRR